MNKRVGVSNVYFAISSVLGALLGCALGIILCFLWGDNSVEIPSLCSFVIAVASFLFSIFSLWFKHCSSKQKRYEETFFNMLEQKRKIVENLKMRSEEWDEIDSVYHDYNANDCFIMIYSEVNNIYMSLFEHGKYENQATQNTSNEATEEIRKNIIEYINE